MKSGIVRVRIQESLHFRHHISTTNLAVYKKYVYYILERHQIQVEMLRNLLDLLINLILFMVIHQDQLNSARSYTCDH